MLLASEKSYTSFSQITAASLGKFATVRNRAGAGRFTRRNEPEVYCSRECRGHVIGRRPQARTPAQYKTHSERRAAKTRQQQVYRSHPSVEKTVRMESETKNLQAQNCSLVLGYSGTWRTAHFEPANVNGDRSKTRVAHSSAECTVSTEAIESRAMEARWKEA